MNINIPPDSQDWLFSDPGDADGASWSFRYPPPCEEGDELIFRFDGRIVARATVHLLATPGELDGWAHHGKRFLSGHKVIWLWSTFEDLREKPEIAVAIAEAERRRRRELAKKRKAIA